MGISISQIEQELKQLSPEKLEVVFDFVSFLKERQHRSGAFQTMLASEAVLRRDWDTHEEDKAWEHLKQPLENAESDLADYRANLEAYEEQLVRGLIKW